MPFLFYSNADPETRKKIEDILRKFVPPRDIETYGNIPAFTQRLKQPLAQEAVVILAPGSREELLEILPLQMQLENCRTIIITPDREAETIALSHRLRPRFLGDMNEDRETLAAVLSKMIAG